MIQRKLAFECDCWPPGTSAPTRCSIKLNHRAFKTVKGKTISKNTVAKYISALENAFLIQKVRRYDVKGRKYIGALAKYYFTDVGIRNCVLGFRRCYVQSAFMVPDREKMALEQRPFSAVADSFQRIMVVKEQGAPWQNEDGTLVIGLRDFLLCPQLTEPVAVATKLLGKGKAAK